jgi:hypothetical protein
MLSPKKIVFEISTDTQENFMLVDSCIEHCKNKTPILMPEFENKKYYIIKCRCRKNGIYSIWLEAE